MRESERWCVQHERAETTNALTCQIILLRDDAAGRRARSSDGRGMGGGWSVGVRRSKQA